MYIEMCLPFSYSFPKCSEIFFFFISFSDDHIRFMYLYLLSNKVEVLNAFNTYKEEEEKQYEDHKI
jgi:hypothetical protein